MVSEAGLKPSEPRVMMGYINNRQFCRRFANFDAMSAWVNQRTYRCTLSFVQVVSLKTWES